MSHLELISDHSKHKLDQVPHHVLNKSNLKMLFLEGNHIRKLPVDIFEKLPKLTWLDMRNNKLKELPKSIGFHAHLETLLLTNNRLEKLPDELGTVPNLKTLQIFDNPLSYPDKSIISDGTTVIKMFLKQQYLKAHEKPPKEESIEHVINDTSSSDSVTKHKKRRHKKEEKTRTGEIVKQVAKHGADPKELVPTLSVKRLSHSSINKLKDAEEPTKIIHKINRRPSKLSLMSYFNKSVKNQLDQVPDGNLKEGWLNKLRILLMDQERILQQERNLKALTSWRQDKRHHTVTTIRDEIPIDPPFGTDPDFQKMVTREELSKELNKFIQDRSMTLSNPNIKKNKNIEKLVNDLVRQLKEMEATYTEMKSPRTEIEQAGKQIKTIMGIHKKLLYLQGSNESLMY